jgi:hypothetical protein
MGGALEGLLVGSGYYGILVRSEGKSLAKQRMEEREFEKFLEESVGSVGGSGGK